MFDHINHCAQGQDIIIRDRMLVGVKGDEVAVDRPCAPRELGFVMRLERQDIKPVPLNPDGAGVLRLDGEPIGDLSGSHVDDGNLIFRREGNICLLVICKGNSNRFVKPGRPGGRVQVLHGGNDLEKGRA